MLLEVWLRSQGADVLNSCQPGYLPCNDGTERFHCRAVIIILGERQRRGVNMELRIPWILDPVGMLESIRSENLGQESKLLSRFFLQDPQNQLFICFVTFRTANLCWFFCWLCNFVTYNVQLAQPPQLTWQPGIWWHHREVPTCTSICVFACF